MVSLFVNKWLLWWSASITLDNNNTVLTDLLPFFHELPRILNRIAYLYRFQTPNAKFSVGNTNMLVSKNAKICINPKANFKICVTPNVNLKFGYPRRKFLNLRYPNASPWNIGWLGPKRKIFTLAMYISFL